MEEDRNSKAKLLAAAIRGKRKEEALRLLNKGTGVDYRDETGSYPLHYAASEGYDDVIEVLLEKGANVMAWDNDGRTALHQAAMYGHARSIVTLVAGGAVVSPLGRRERLPLEYAINNKQMTAAKLLCQFGSELSLKDWSWMSQVDVRKKNDEMARILRHHSSISPGYRHGAIVFDVAKVTPEVQPALKLQRTGVEITVVEGQECYYLYVCKKEEAYGSSPPLEPGEKVFGHLLECQTWGPRVKTITLTVTVDQVLRGNEEIVLRPETQKGGVDNVVIQKNSTRVTMTVPLQPTGITYFTMVSREKTEVFKISEEAVVLKPETEPEAEINIPAGTFHSGELLVKFLDTKNASYEQDEQVNQAPILLTNILDIFTIDDQKPQKDIQIKLPVRVTHEPQDVLVLSTAHPDPDLEKWDWEVIPAEVDGNAVLFTVKHFSPNVAVSTSQFDNNPEHVKDVCRNANLKMRKVEFLVAIKTPEVDESKAEMIIACGSQRGIASARRTKYRNYQCFIAEQNTDFFLFPEGQIFQIVIRGNLTEQSDDDNMRLIFKSSDEESSRALEVVSTCPDPRNLQGEVDIIKKNKETVEQVNAEYCSCLCKAKVTKSGVEKNNTSAQTMCTIPFNIALTMSSN